MCHQLKTCISLYQDASWSYFLFYAAEYSLFQPPAWLVVVVVTDRMRNWAIEMTIGISCCYQPTTRLLVIWGDIGRYAVEKSQTSGITIYSVTVRLEPIIAGHHQTYSNALQCGSCKGCERSAFWWLITFGTGQNWTYMYYLLIQGLERDRAVISLDNTGDDTFIL